MQPIRQINPDLNSELTSILFELERLRYLAVGGTTPPWLFFDLKDIMHLLESVASARIEGNRTTVVSAANDVIGKQRPTHDESILELRNIRQAVAFVENNISSDGKITLGLVRELHKIIVKDLKNDGSKTPGRFRGENVQIAKSAHKTPSHIEVNGLMQELVDYINKPCDHQFDIIKTAIAHHRFTAIHPFDNGNGRSARLLTYAMLTSQRFIDEEGSRLLNPSSIFCIDRQEYYDQLAKADKGRGKDLESWCLYVARGIQAEIGRVSKLLDKNFAAPNIILPALKAARRDNIISNNEFNILAIAIDKDIIQAGDVKHLFGVSASAGVQTSRVLATMRQKGLIMALPKHQKRYVLKFSNNYLLRYVLENMNSNNLLPITNEAL
jgi:Fic family protein